MAVYSLEAAALLIEIGGTAKGTQYDSLEVAGMATPGGTLNVSLVHGFLPAIGNSFEIVSADAGISGAFANEVLPALTGGLSWSIVYGANSVLL